MQVDKLRYTGTRTNNFTVYQTHNSFYSASNWASYLICNYGNADAYKQVIRFPFADGGNNVAPQYLRIENGSSTGWKNFVTDENFDSYVSTYISNH